MADPTGAQRSHERIRDLRLADHLGKGFWPVAAIECGDHGSMLSSAADIVWVSHEMSGKYPEPVYGAVTSCHVCRAISASSSVGITSTATRESSVLMRRDV